MSSLSFLPPGRCRFNGGALLELLLLELLLLLMLLITETGAATEDNVVLLKPSLVLPAADDIAAVDDIAHLSMDRFVCEYQCSNQRSM
jgi:hypothetical protein